MDFLKNKWVHLGIVLALTAAPVVAANTDVAVPDYVNSLLTILAALSGGVGVANAAAKR